MSTSDTRPSEAATMTSPAGNAPEPTREVGQSSHWGRFQASRLGVLLATLVTTVIFSVLRPDTFATWTNATNILQQAAVPAVLALGLTVTLVLGDFDLSIGATVGLTMGVAVILMAEHGVSWWLAGLAALAVGIMIGLLNGIMVSYMGLNSFIATLASASVLAGLEAKVTAQQVIYQGVPQSFKELGRGELAFGVAYPVWIALGTVVVLYLLMNQTEGGRYMYAVGGNKVASELAGLSVRRLRVIGFVVTAFCAAGAGILLASRSGSYYPSAGSGMLLPAYAAAFLGAAAAKGMKFSILGTVLGIIFLGIIQSGLSLMNVQSWVVNVVQGLVLIGAVSLHLFDRRT